MDRVDSAAMSATFSARTAPELAARYATWAESYDAENAAAGFRLPYLCSALLARYVPRGSGPILDAGCGTGAAGDCLRILGYGELVGLDLSEPMLARAASRGIYRALHCMMLGQALDFPSDHFAAGLASGVFTEGHATADSFDELIRITRPGGVLVFSVRDDIFERQGFRERQAELEAEDRWRLEEMSEPFRSFTIREPDIYARAFAYRVG